MNKFNPWMEPELHPGQVYSRINERFGVITQKDQEIPSWIFKQGKEGHTYLIDSRGEVIDITSKVKWRPIKNETTRG